MSQPCVRASGLEKSFGDDGVLEGVDLAIESGELLAIMGPNGVGKSVLFSCLAGSQRPSAGTVEVFGADPTTRSDTTGFLLQDALCVDRLTGRENIRFYDQLHPRFTDDWRTHVDELDLADELDKRVADYSGGMKRKLELSIALSIDVPIYLLDEPTAALDLSMIQVVHRLIREKHAEGKTVVVATHLPMDAEIADRIAFLTEDGIVETGPPEALLESVPPVVVATGRSTESLRDVVRDGRLFETDGTIRGFLHPDADGETIDRNGELSVSKPTYIDLFNYYTERSPTTT